jgi:hypothetical protein
VRRSTDQEAAESHPKFEANWLIPIVAPSASSIPRSAAYSAAKSESLPMICVTATAPSSPHASVESMKAPAMRMPPAATNGIM